MGVFGLKYPPQLQAVMDHAERFCELLAQLERRRPALAVCGRKWLVRRRSEVEAVLSLVIADLAADRISIRAAARSAARYLDELHLGAERSLGLDAPLSCCDQDEALTIHLTSKRDAVTIEAVTRVLGGSAQAPVANETWLDPAALLDVHPTADGREGEPRPASSGKTSRPSVALGPGQANDVKSRDAV